MFINQKSRNKTTMLKDLLSRTISVDSWCQNIISKQENQIVSALTNPKDLNVEIKLAVQEILDYLKSQGNQGMEEVEDSTLKSALKILLTYLKQHEVWKPNKCLPLTGIELECAFNDLYIDKYVRCDRKFQDPSIHNQHYSLFSFVPSTKAQPDESGFYGFIKIRGTFDRLEEAEEKAKELIQYFSANQIFVCETGKPVPLQKEVVNKADVIEIDDPNRSEEALKFHELTREQSLKEKQAIEEIKQREEALRQDVTKDPNDKDPLQRYLECVHKRATCAYLYTQHLKKLEETKNIIINARQQLATMDEEYPELKDKYLEHYNDTCKQSGIDQATDDMAVYIRKFIGEDADLGF